MFLNLKKNVADAEDAVNLMDIMTIQMYVPNKKQTQHNNKKFEKDATNIKI